MKEEEVKKLVHEFLKKKGYQKTLETLENEELKPTISINELTPTTLSTSNDFTKIVNDSQKRIVQGYQNLIEWVISSLDIYKGELEKVLFPVFVHSYLELISKNQTQEANKFFLKYKSQHVHVHANEILTLEGIQTSTHIAENEFAQRALKNKFQLEISHSSYELLLKFLQDTSELSILSIINQFINFKVLKGQPSQSSQMIFREDDEGNEEEDEKNMTLTKIYWEIKTPHVPSKRGRKKKVDLTLVQKVIPPSVCFYTLFNVQVNSINIGITQDKPIIVGGFDDSTVKFWQNENYETLTGHFGPVYGTSLSSCRKWLLSSSEDGTARLWNLDTKSNLVVYKGHQYPVWDCDFSKIDYLFATASHDKTARIWSTERLTPLRIMAGHTSDVDCVKFHPNCNYIATGSSDKSVRLWDVQSGECVRAFIGHYGSVHSLAFSNDGKYLATGGSDNEIFVWDISTQKMVNHLRGHTDDITSLSFNDDGSLLVSGSLDQSVKIWNLQSDANTYYTKQTPVYYVHFHKNCILASGPFQPKETSLYQ